MTLDAERAVPDGAVTDGAASDVDDEAPPPDGATEPPDGVAGPADDAAAITGEVVTDDGSTDDESTDGGSTGGASTDDPVGSGTAVASPESAASDAASSESPSVAAAAPPPERRRRTRSRRLRRAVILLLAVCVGVAGWLYGMARADLAGTRDDLDQARDDLVIVQDDLALEQERAALTGASIEQVRIDIESQVATRTWLDAVAANTATEIAAVDAERVETDTARVLVAANSADALGCFDGVAGAIDASRAGNDGAAAQALGNASGACSRTLAYATGARFPYDFADPYVLAAGGRYYGYSTNSGAGDIQVIRSSDLVSWELVGNALAGLPMWAARGSTWAPAVLARPGSGYVAYYTVRDAATGNQCVSSAVASSPVGPFRDDSWGPLVCQHEHGGSIDPSPFVDADGRAYLLWKAENHGGSPQTVWGQELSADGRSVVGSPAALISADRGFEHGVVEAPSMVREGGTYVLAYAAADWNSRRYAAAFATCAGPLGPCTKPADGRVLTSGPRLGGPGGVELFRAHDGALWAAFHAFSEPNVGYPSSRYLHLAPARLRDGRLVIDAET